MLTLLLVPLVDEPEGARFVCGTFDRSLRSNHEVPAVPTSIAIVFPDLSRMDAATAAALAQVVPVIMLTLLFEIPVRRRINAPSPRVRTVFLSFIWNLVVGSVAIATEFGLLGVVQHDGIRSNAEWMWIPVFALFVIVILRWTATTALGQLVRENGPVLKTGIAEFRNGVVAGATSVLSNPFDALVQAMALVIGALAVSFASVGRIYARAFLDIWSAARMPGPTLVAFMGDVGASVVAAISSVSSLPRFFIEAVRDLFRKL